MPDLVGHDRRASAFVVFLALWRRTGGAARPAVVSHQRLAGDTGLSRCSVQAALALLERRGLVELTRRRPTDATRARLSCHWRR
jgi:DNA-binding transcriptional ArsR family regulator